MRRIKGTYILIPLFCTLLCIGCDNEDTTLMPTQPIGFSTSVDDSNTRADSDTDAATRAEATTANLTEIGVFAYNTGTSYMASTGFAPNLLCNQSVKKVNGTWTYSPVKYWPANPNDKVSFFAYAPHSASVPSGGDQISAAPTSVTTNGSPAIIYAPVKGELDILYSLGELNCTNNHGTVRFTMKHATTKVIFKVKVEGGGSKTITGVSTECVYATGIKFNGSDTGITVRTLSKNRTTCTATNLNINAGSTATTVKEFFLPPDHMTDTKVSLSYLDGSTTKTIETTLPNANDWILGKAIGYTFTIKDNQIISIAVDADMAWDAQEKPKPKYEGYDYVIATAEDLANFRDDVNNGKATNKNAIQIADINLQDLASSSNSSHTTDANDWFPIGIAEKPFSGTYNGNGHTISNLNLGGARYRTTAGLFGGSNGTLIGIHLRAVNITPLAILQYTGALVGYASGGNIAACSASGSINKVSCYNVINDGKVYATGGLIGSAANTTISFCRSDVNIGENGIITDRASTAPYLCYVGGFIGKISVCNILSCRSSGYIKLGTFNAPNQHIIRVGGFIGSDTDGSIGNEIYGSYSSTTGAIEVSFTGDSGSSSGSVQELLIGGFIGYTGSAGSNTYNCRACYSYSPITLIHPQLENSSTLMSNFRIGGFVAKIETTSRIISCYYGLDLKELKSGVFQNALTAYFFAPSSSYVQSCYYVSQGKIAQNIMWNGGTSNTRFNFIKYAPATNSYFTDYITKPWNSRKFWKETPANTAYPEINYDELNITP